MEAASTSKCFEAGVMIHSGFSMAGTAIEASGTDAQPDAAGSVLRELGNLPNKQKIAFVSRKSCLQKSEKCFERTIFCLLGRR